MNNIEKLPTATNKLNEELQAKLHRPKHTISAKHTVETFELLHEQLNEQHIALNNDLVKLQGDMELIQARIDQTIADINSKAKEIAVIGVAAIQTREIEQQAIDLTLPKKPKKSISSVKKAHKNVS